MEPIEVIDRAFDVIEACQRYATANAQARRSEDPLGAIWADLAAERLTTPRDGLQQISAFLQTRSVPFETAGMIRRRNEFTPEIIASAAQLGSDSSAKVILTWLIEAAAIAYEYKPVTERTLAHAIPTGYYETGRMLQLCHIADSIIDTGVQLQLPTVEGHTL